MVHELKSLSYCIRMSCFLPFFDFFFTKQNSDVFCIVNPITNFHMAFFRIDLLMRAISYIYIFKICKIFTGSSVNF